MNAFVGYENKPHHHEDNLTRAFLIVLRGVPVAHAAWLDLVDHAHRANKGLGVPRLHSLAAPVIYTQVERVPGGVKRVISLVQTDEHVFKDRDLASSGRRQVLDGVVVYDELALVIENKPHHRNIREAQLEISVDPGVTLDPRTACITWKDVVAAWGRLLEARHLGPAEAVLLGDFLDYVEMHFPRLRPYSKVALCGADMERLGRRCRQLLLSLLAEGTAEDTVRYHRGWGWYVFLGENQSARQLGFFPRRFDNDVALVVEIDPGDTMRQAKVLYRNARCDQIVELTKRGWAVRPNLHVSHMTSGLVWTTVGLSLEDYWRVWAMGSTLFRQWRRNEFDAFFSALVRAQLAEPRDKDEFDRKVTRTSRTKINVCPGLSMKWRLPLDEASMLDSRGTLEGRIRTAICEAAQALGLQLPFMT